MPTPCSAVALLPILQPNTNKDAASLNRSIILTAVPLAITLKAHNNSHHTRININMDMNMKINIMNPINPTNLKKKVYSFLGINVTKINNYRHQTNTIIILPMCLKTFLIYIINCISIEILSLDYSLSLSTPKTDKIIKLLPSQP